MISTLAWVPRGAAKRVPLRQELSEEELAALRVRAAEEVAAAGRSAFHAGAGGDSDDEGDDSEGEAAPKRTVEEVMADPAFASLRGVALPPGVRLDEDDEDEMMGAAAATAAARGASSLRAAAAAAAAVKGGKGGKGGGGGGAAAAAAAAAAEAAVFGHDGDDDDDDSDGDSEDAEDYVARPSDAFLLAGNTQEDNSSLEVYCYNAEDGTLYVHHDITLPAFPLCTAWMDYAGEGAARTMAAQCGLGGTPAGEFVGSYVAVGTFKPDIEVWNLDVIDPLEPAVVLKGTKPVLPGAAGAAAAAGGAGSSSAGKGKKGAGSAATKGHSDAVMGLAWNKTHRQLLASSSADKTVKLWDLDAGGRVLQTFAHHRGKVQAVAWNPVEATILASASFDRTVAMLDARDGADAKVFRYALPADSECLLWHPHAPAALIASCEDGSVLAYDVRAPDSPLWRLQAHKAATNSVSLSTLVTGLMATASLDRTVKLWDTDNLDAAGAPSAVSSKEMSIGQIYSVTFMPQAPYLLAAAGSKGLVAIWDLAADAGLPARDALPLPADAPPAGDDVNDIVRRFGGRAVDAATVPAATVRPRPDGQPLA